MKTFVQKTYDEIANRGLSYSPSLFDEIYNEIKSNPKNIEEELLRTQSFNTTNPNTFSLDNICYSRKNNHFTNL